LPELLRVNVPVPVFVTPPVPVNLPANVPVPSLCPAVPIVRVRVPKTTSEEELVLLIAFMVLLPAEISNLA
jgi:hypothetical protein